MLFHKNRNNTSTNDAFEVRLGFKRSFRLAGGYNVRVVNSSYLQSYIDEKHVKRE